MSGGYDYSIDLPRWDTQKKEDTLELNDQVGLEKVATVDAKLGRPKSSRLGPAYANAQRKGRIAKVASAQIQTTSTSRDGTFF